MKQGMMITLIAEPGTINAEAKISMCGTTNITKTNITCLGFIAIHCLAIH